MRQKKPSENPEGLSIAAGDMRYTHPSFTIPPDLPLEKGGAGPA